MLPQGDPPVEQPTVGEPVGKPDEEHPPRQTVRPSRVPGPRPACRQEYSTMDEHECSGLHDCGSWLTSPLPREKHGGMKRIHALYVRYLGACLCFVCVATYSSEQLESAQKAYAAQLEKVAFEVTLQKEELLGRILKRLDALESEARQKGNVDGAMSAQEMREKVLASKGPYLSATVLHPVVSSAGQEFALGWARLGELEQRRRLELAQKMEAFLRAQRTRLANENKMAEARLFFDRGESLAAEMDVMRAAAARIPSGANPYARKAAPELEHALKAFGLGMRASAPDWEVLDLNILAFLHARDTLMIRPIRYPHAHHKIVMGDRPLQVGDEFFIELAGADTLEFMSTGEIRQYVSYKVPNRSEFYRMQVRRHLTGAEIWLNDVPLPVARLSMLEDNQREVFLRGETYFVVRFGGSDTVSIRSFEFRSKIRQPEPKAEPIPPGLNTNEWPAQHATSGEPDNAHKPRQGQDWVVAALPEASLRWIPPGRFAYGSTAAERAWAAGTEGQGKEDWFADETEREKRQVHQGFWLGETEVTQAQFGYFVHASDYRTEAEQVGHTTTIRNGAWAKVKHISWRMPFLDYPAYGPDHPVVCVSANDAEAFCAWLTMVEQKSGRLPVGYFYRLPSELEWEYACRGGREGLRFWWSDTWADGKGRLNAAGQDPFPGGGAWTGLSGWSDGYPFTSPAGHFRVRGANGYRLLDMLGNVWEWTTTRYEGQADQRVLRGGSFNNHPCELRCANRGGYLHSRAYCDNGFRLCLSPYDPQEK